mmetsp:Transcript_2229/g.3407  ORF Transcript_2229/g.3407 Transcript_2229/m.3407 type:complete len:270 (-) Transcript_2229:62-871(-)|eukprot:CAMPEP_0195298236 /NCGR_PEP_ID=MMETSP0707-20130614/23046_1 /TAXON_ID=33640 /ORGANISM="Asterionellopsis glacialis, Strain CCMP134" /LENGTH=269 /DNA_ID=CAMNT_0040360269 /DNA_START=315 /DNA_END=1124 /DNA_ORIENTATION=-
MSVTDDSLRSSTHEYDEDMEESLRESLPDSTVAERRRFLKARDGDVDAATQQYKAYAAWRKEINLENIAFDKNDDKSLWKYASRRAAEIDLGEAIELPEILYTHHYGEDSVEEVTTKDNFRILHLIPARLDTKIAPANTYGLALALFLELHMPHNSMEKFYIMLDVRAGTGWPNPWASSLIPFIRTTTKLLNNYFPERLQRCVLYPMPRLSLYLWDMVKKYLDQDTASKIVLLRGKAGETDPVPESLADYVDEKVSQILEDCRVGTFIT